MGEPLVHAHRHPVLHAGVPLFHRVTHQDAALHLPHIHVVHRLEAQGLGFNRALVVGSGNFVDVFFSGFDIYSGLRDSLYMDYVPFYKFNTYNRKLSSRYLQYRWTIIISTCAINDKT